MFTLVLIIVQAWVIVYMAYDRSYGCLTRAAFNLLYPILKLSGYQFIFGDVDGFKSLNSKYGHEQVNRMVKQSIRHFMRSFDIVFRVYSGDEFIVATRSRDLGSIVSRLCHSFVAQGMRLTCEVITGTLETASIKVIQSKKGASHE